METSPTFYEPNKKIVTWLGRSKTGKARGDSKLDMICWQKTIAGLLDMDSVKCTKCGYSDVAVVRRQVIAGGGGFKKTYRCPRCSNVWESKT